MLRVGRRGFLQAAGGLAAALAGFAAYRSMPGGGDAFAPNPQLEALIAAGDFSVELGGKHLQDLGLASKDVFESLHAEVMEGLAERSADLRRELNSKVVQDFAAGRVCRVDGWQLSATECRLAALAFLFKESGGRIAAPTAGDQSPLSGLPESSIAELVNWGPRFGFVGEGFNVQPSGSSALWFLFANLDQQPYEIFFGASPLRTSVVGDKNLITATVTRGQVRRLTRKPAEVPIHLVSSIEGSKQLLGRFSVRAKGESTGGERE